MTSRSRRRALVAAAAAVLASASMAARLASAQDLLRPAEAFQIRSAAPAGPWLEVVFWAAPGYAIYAERIAFATTPGARVAAVELPPGERKFEEALGQTLTHLRGLVRVRVRVEAGVAPFNLTATAQGCADVGVCYPPVARTFEIRAGS